jgi:hypothetical protein
VHLNEKKIIIMLKFLRKIYIKYFGIKVLGFTMVSKCGPSEQNKKSPLVCHFYRSQFHPFWTFGGTFGEPPLWNKGTKTTYLAMLFWTFWGGLFWEPPCEIRAPKQPPIWPRVRNFFFFGVGGWGQKKKSKFLL